METRSGFASALALTLLAGAALAPGASAGEVAPSKWTVAGTGTPSKGERLALSVPSTVSLQQPGSRPRRIALRVEGRDCLAQGRLSLGAKTLKRFPIRSESRFVRTTMRPGPGRHRLEVTVRPRGDCPGGVVIERTAVREWVPIGSTAVASNLRADVPYGNLLAGNLDSLTVGTDLQFSVVEPRRGAFQFAGADQVVDFATSHGMEVRGHPLIWWAFMPRWITTGNFTRDQLIDVMHAHITALVSRYRGRISEWDVVNEAIEADGSYRHNSWYDVIGPDYIELAFRFAHEADPSARLYLNEVDAEVRNTRSDALYELASSLLNADVPIDGVGFQGHVFYAPGNGADAIADNFHRFAELGLDVQVTEADVPDDTIAAQSQTQRVGVQAEAFRTLADACHREPACVRFTMWGLSDRYSWLGTNRHPLPFDAALQPKPAWPALEQELRPPPAE